MPERASSPGSIHVRGARQNNLKNLDLRLPLNRLTVITGVSGSGKSSLAFDTVYSEGQRRYVETFSPYARQFLDRMDRPHCDAIEGIPPAIAIDQTNPVRTSRSTVGTMTELNDHLKLLFARAARLYCRICGDEIRRDSPRSIFADLVERFGGGEPPPRILITFTVPVPESFGSEEIEQLLARQGYARIHRREGERLEVIQDRARLSAANRARIAEALEAALRHGRGALHVHRLDARGEAAQTRGYSSALACARCGARHQAALPGLFSFNSPVGACETCRGFGRTMGIDYDLVIPDPRLSLAEGAIKVWQSKSYRSCQRDLMRYARRREVPVDRPWRRLSARERRWVLEGEGEWDEGVWYGVRRFFDWIETKSYKMHIRVLLSKYRAYAPCPECGGARLKPAALDWRVGDAADADRALGKRSRFRPVGSAWSEARRHALPGLTIHDLVLLPVEDCARFFESVHLPAPMDEATALLLDEIRARLRYLVEVGLGYLSLDRQSRTLSGGEVQRINLTTALGTSLVNALFVLDEPSIGLHARDMRRVVGVLHRLRDAGNTLLVVEHDAQVMLAADQVLDLGPGPGERGGEVVFFGPPSALLERGTSLTAQYLRDERRVAARAAPGRAAEAGSLEVLGAAEHNLKGIDVRIPLRRLVCVTGVSGSGKSTLVEDICYRGLRKLSGKASEPAGAHRAIRGHERLGDIVMVDQSPIGKTARSNPASYVGALDAIRKVFAGEPLARERGYTAGTFSFNAGAGRCPACGGSGFEHIEMQFLSDVYLRCPDCEGRRYRPEVLEVELLPPDAGHAKGGHACSIADVLAMSAAQAIDFFREHPEVGRVLEPLVAVGLDYLRLGQPVPTLSGGEAQRLKLAGHLAKARKAGAGGGEGILFLLDEPTTGLHFDDIATLLGALRRLIEEGHSLVVIEHNLDVIRAADWVIDLGPEGGDAGGELVFCGTPEDVKGCARSHTGAALAAAEGAVPEAADGAVAGTARVAESPARYHAAGRHDAISVHRAREHNLKDIDLHIPRDSFTVITGISGSGKSTVAFDILFAEGQRRYLESLNAYARQFVQPAARPDVDAILGVPPTVAIEQRTSRGGRKSTVATLTELYHFLRLLFVKLGVWHCPDCEFAIEAQTPDAVLARLLSEYRGRRVALLSPLVVARKGYYSDLAKWAAGKGFAQLRVDGQWLPTAAWPRLDRFREHDIELPVGEITVSPAGESALRKLLARALDFGKGLVKVSVESPEARPEGPERIFSTRRACPSCGRSFPEPDPRLFSFNSRHGWCERCYGTGLELEGFDAEQSGEERWWNEWWEAQDVTCRSCGGKRLRAEALAVRFRERNIAEISALSVEDAERFVRTLELDLREEQIARDIRRELTSRLHFLRQVGLGYLSLDRAAPTLSGGEAQRIRLAASLGSNLRGVCYILDEPTIGLHTRDNRMLLETLKRLEKKGNTVVVVEHDEETIRQAGHVIDLGPGAGRNGGHVVAAGSVEELLADPRSVTGRFLAAPLRHARRVRKGRNGKGEASALRVVDADLNNLDALEASFPLGCLTCVTGVSGSGKSTLVRSVLLENLTRRLSARRRRGGRPPALRGCGQLTGWEGVSRVLEVDQTPIGKTPRSCPATYIGVWERIRRLFAETTESRIRGYGPGRFSFNVSGGRCDACEGQGVRRVAMNFLPDVRVTCDACGGARFNPETLAVTYREQSIADVLAMNVDQALEFFAAHPPVHHALRLLQEVGLGYLTLGQPSPTLSGGEAQRIKLVTELARTRPSDPVRIRGRKGAREAAPKRDPHSLYVLDEPTIGLHMADVARLIEVLHRLVDAGNTVVVIEHNLDIIAEADHIIDLGPEGGDGGGRIVASGSPAQVARRTRRSHTGRVLNEFLRERGAPG